MWSGQLGRINATEHSIILKTEKRLVHKHSVQEGTKDARGHVREPRRAEQLESSMIEPKHRMSASRGLRGNEKRKAPILHRVQKAELGNVVYSYRLLMLE